VLFSIYQSQGIKYYLIVDPDLQEAEVYVLTDNEYKMMAKGKDISHRYELDTCNAVVDYSEIWK